MDYQEQSIFSHHLDPQGSQYLLDASKWAKFLSIVGFVFTGLMVILSLVLGSFIDASMSSMGGFAGGIGGGVITTMYIFIALIWFFPCLFLFRFATNAQKALATNETEKITESLKNLKSCFRFMGIFTIIILSIYALGIIVVLIGGAMSI